MLLQQLFSLFADQTCKPKGGFLGLIPWYQYINDSKHFVNSDHPKLAHGCDLKNFTLLPGNGQTSDVPLVLLAVVDDLLRIAGIIAVAFVLVGAIKYISSQGNPESTASAQSTVINALIGLAISIVSVAFVSFLGSKLGK